MITTIFDRFPRPPCAELLGWEVVDQDPARGCIKIAFQARPEFLNPAGFVQGGLLAAMLDDTMGPAVFAMTDGRLYTATITMTVNFLAPAMVGPITGEASVTQLGKTIAFVEAKLIAAHRAVIATATASVRLVEAAKAIR